MTSCTWDYVTSTPANKSYTLMLCCFVFFIPLGIISYCYLSMFLAIRQASRYIQINRFIIFNIINITFFLNMHNLILFLGSHFNTCLLEVPFWPLACKPVKKGEKNTFSNKQYSPLWRVLQEVMKVGFLDTTQGPSISFQWTKLKFLSVRSSGQDHASQCFCTQSICSIGQLVQFYCKLVRHLTNNLSLCLPGL